MTDKTCCFTGHRKIPADQYQTIAEETEKIIEKLIEQGYLFFYAGGALGFDTIVEKAVINLKEKYPKIALVLVLPCTTQSAKWSDEDKETYEKIKAKANIILHLYNKYTWGCMHERNRFLVDNSSVCVCYLTQNRGGTVYTVNYAKKNGLPVLNVADSAQVAAFLENGTIRDCES